MYMFYSAFRGWPLQTIGYPISRRFTYRGFSTQVFEKVALQWQPGRGVHVVNLLDDLHEAGLDSWMDDRHDIPPPGDTSPDTGLSWDQVVDRHLAMLDGSRRLKEGYLREPRWLGLYWLPVGSVDYLSAGIVRGRRAALKLWKINPPVPALDDLSVIYGVDLAREAGLFPPDALVPGPPPRRGGASSFAAFVVQRASPGGAHCSRPGIVVEYQHQRA